MSRPRAFAAPAVRTFALAAAALLIVGTSACAAPAAPDPVPSATGVEAAVVVQVVDNQYVPAEVEIQVGEAVTWEFLGSMEHDVVAADGSFVSDLMRSGSYTAVFDRAGEYGYECSIHPEMTGMVRVIPAT